MKILMVEGPGTYPAAYAGTLADALKALGHGVLIRPWAGIPGFRADRREYGRLAGFLLERTRPEIAHVLSDESWVAEAFTGHGVPVVHTTGDRPSRADWVVAPSKIALQKIRASGADLDYRLGQLHYAVRAGGLERSRGSYVLACVDPRDAVAREWMELAACECPSIPLRDEGDVREARFVVSLSSRPEPWAPGVAEAMAAARPVVASWSGAAPELVLEGVTGFLCGPGDLHGLRTQMEYLWGDPDEALRLGAKGLDHARELFDPGTHARSLLRWYLRAGASRLAV